MPSGTLGPIHIKVHCGLHDAVHIIDDTVSPSVTVYVVVGGNSVADSGPFRMNIHTMSIKTILSRISGM